MLLYTNAFYITGSSINSRRYLSSTSSISKLHFSIANVFSPQSTSNTNANNNDNKLKLISLLSQVSPNESTSKQLTKEILLATSILEKQCPTLDENVLQNLIGNWELIWTAQDKSSLQYRDDDSDRWRRLNPFATFINPLENQSYSNNPINNKNNGRSNPILPQNIQDTMEDIGILSTPNSKDNNTIKSTQSINLKKNRIRNVVAFELNNPISSAKGSSTIKGFIKVDVKGYPNRNDKRKIDVKFDSCRVSFLNSPIDITFPLGIIGPTGWLRTSYVDDDIRITRGHKGSVFILSRTSNNK